MFAKIPDIKRLRELKDQKSALLKRVAEIKIDLDEFEELADAVREFKDDYTFPQKYGEFFVFHNATETKRRVDAEKRRLDTIMRKLSRKLRNVEENIAALSQNGADSDE